MKDDPIVAEVRAIRDQLAAQCGYDLKEIFRQVREQQDSSGRQYVRFLARRAVITDHPEASDRDTKST